MRNLHSDAFVELNRTFHELSANGRLTDDDQLRAALFRGDTLAWEQLLQEYRVVILSEAGSGKTEEIRHQTDELRAKGNPAFFLRLEHVATDFEEAFEIGSHEEFKNWVAAAFSR